MRQQQTGRAAADDRDLSARSRGHNKAYQNPNCGYWQANLAGKPRRRRQACVGGLMPRYEGERRASQRLPAAARKRSYNRGLHSGLMGDNAAVPIFEVSMFETFKSFISDFVEGEKHPSQFADNDYRLAAAALLVHAAAIDGEMSQRERDKLRSVTKQRFALNNQPTDELITKATEAEHKSVAL